MIKKLKNNFITLILAIITLFGLLPAITFNAFASAPTSANFDETDVIKDLEGAGLNLADYPYDLSGKYKTPTVINFIEYGYSANEAKKGDYALYVYFYNPGNYKIDENSKSNRIQLATSYESYPVTRDTAPTGYSTFEIKYLSKSTGDKDGLFYKFKIIDRKTAPDYLRIEERVNSNERRYDVSGITLCGPSGASKEFAVGGTFRFTGFSVGYGPNGNNENTLANSGYDYLETISLEVNSTTYRTTSSSLGVGHQNSISSVYFSVPNKFLTDKAGNLSGNLQKIKAEWWEYKTEPMLVLNYEKDYEQVLPYVGIEIVERNENIDRFWFKDKQGGVYIGAYNCSFEAVNVIDTMYYVFNSANGMVPSSEVEGYIKSYSASASKGYLPIKNGNISADLFIDEVDAGRTRGYNCVEVDANDKFNILSYQSNHSGWDRFWDYGFSKIDTNDGRTDVTPIYQITNSDVNKMDLLFSNELMVDKEDAGAIKSFALNALSNNQTPFLFRFAQTDYFSEKLYSDSYKTIFSHKDDRGDFLAQQTVFFDFKIIHLTFKVDGELRTVPVVQDPIDIVPGITPPPQQITVVDTIKAWLIFLVACVVGLIVLYGVIQALIGILKIEQWWLKIILFILLAVAVALICLYGVPWVVDLINKYGGLQIEEGGIL